MKNKNMPSTTKALGTEGPEPQEWSAMLAKNHMSHLVKMSFLGACLGLAAALAVALSMV